MGRYVGAIDQGTTSTRFMLFDQAGSLIAGAHREHAQICPRQGWVEHDAVEILANVEYVAGAALQQAGLSAADLDCVGITNQRETTVLWHRGTGVPLHNALVWQDTRVAGMVAEYAKQGGTGRFRATTGLPLATYFSALKLRWLLDQHDPDGTLAAAGELAFGTMDSWLLWNLSGGPGQGIHATDVTNASRTQMMSLASLHWDPELLRAFGVSGQLLPQIRSCSEFHSEVRSGVLKGVPITALLGDQQAALVGQTCFAAGEIKNTYGTGCFMLLNTGERIVESDCGLITTVAYRFGTQPVCYGLEGSVAVAGGLVQWLRDQLGIIRDSSEIEALAGSVEDNGGVYVVPAFSGLFAPHWRPDARGVITGLTQYANRAHLARAALEAAAFQTSEVLEAMQRDTGLTVSQLRVDGGMTVNGLLMQFQSDLLGVPVLRPRVVETTALGAAYAAGLATGYWKNTDTLRENWRVDASWQPCMPRPQRDARMKQWRKAVARSLDWVV